MDVEVQKLLSSKYLYIAIASLAIWIMLPSKISFIIWLCVVGFLGFWIGYYSKDEHVSISMERTIPEIFAQIQTEALENSKKDEHKFSKPVQKALNFFTDRLTQSFITIWFKNLNKSGSKEFEKCIHSVIMQAAHNFVKYAGIRILDITTLVTFGFTNAFIVHVREYRKYEDLKCSIEEFLNRKEIRESSKYQFNDQPSEVAYLFNHAGLMLDRLLPKAESSSILVHALLKEILASQVLHNIIMV